MIDLHSGCSLWTVRTCKSRKDLLDCKVCEPLKHPNAELYNWETDHPGCSLVFGSGRAKWCWLFLTHLYLYFTVSHSMASRQREAKALLKLCNTTTPWKYSGNWQCDLLPLFFLQRKLQPDFISSNPIASSCSPLLLLSLPSSPMLSLPASYKIYPFGRMWRWVMDQQHVSFRTHSNVPMSCFALLPPSCFPHLLSLPSSEVKFFVLSFCTSSVLSLPFSTTPHPPFRH